MNGLLTKHELKVSNHFNMQSEFTVLQSAIRDLKKFKARI